MMLRLPYPQVIRKRPRRFHRFQPIISLMNEYGDCGICDECMANFVTQVEYERPGHTWTVIQGKLVYMEDLVAASMLGRPLSPNEQVVHKDSNPSNNTRANLEIIKIDSDAL